MEALGRLTGREKTKGSSALPSHKGCRAMWVKEQIAKSQEGPLLAWPLCPRLHVSGCEPGLRMCSREKALFKKNCIGEHWG